MIASILTSVKKGISGLAEEDTSFDDVLIMHINSSLAKLTQLGIGPEEGFQISDKTAVWRDFVGDDKTLNMVQSYVIADVRMIFDPPTIGAVADAFKTCIAELGLRLREQASYNKSKGSDQNAGD
jgi:hypothetical protein